MYKILSLVTRAERFLCTFCWSVWFFVVDRLRVFFCLFSCSAVCFHCLFLSPSQIQDINCLSVLLFANSFPSWRVKWTESVKGFWLVGVWVVFSSSKTYWKYLFHPAIASTPWCLWSRGSHMVAQWLTPGLREDAALVRPDEWGCLLFLETSGRHSTILPLITHFSL